MNALLIGGPKDGEIFAVPEGQFALRAVACDMRPARYWAEDPDALMPVVTRTIQYDLKPVRLFARNIMVGIEGWCFSDDKLARGLLRDHAYDLWKDARGR